MAGTNNSGRGSVNSNNNKQTKGTATSRSNSGKSTASRTTSTRANSSSNSRSNNTRPSNNRYDDSYVYERKEAARRAFIEEDNSRKDEIMLFVYLAIAVFMFVSNFGLCGFVGNIISGFIFGMVGSVAYILPVYLFLAAAYFLVNGAHRKVVRRVECITLFIIAAAFIFQLVQGAEHIGIKGLYMDGYKDKSGGGVLLGGVLVLLFKLIGLPGSIIVIGLLVIIGIIVVMDISLVDLFKGKLEKRREIMSRPDYDPESYKYTENPNTDTNVLGSIEVLDSSEASAGNTKAAGKVETKKSKKAEKNKVVKEEEIHELKPIKQNSDIDSKQLTAPSNTPIEFFNITPNRDNSVYDNNYNESYTQDTYGNQYQDPNAGFFEKTSFANNDMYAGQFADNSYANNSYADNNGYDASNAQNVDNDYTDLYGYNADRDYNMSNTMNEANGSDTTFEQNIDNGYNGQPEYTDNNYDANADSAFSDNTSNYDANADSAFDSVTELYGQSVDVNSFADEAAVFDFDEQKRKRSKTKETTAEMEQERDAIAAMDSVASVAAKPSAVSADNTVNADKSVEAKLNNKPSANKSAQYKLPSVNLLKPMKGGPGRNNARELEETARLLETTLANFGVNVTVTEHTCGPAVTRFELQPEMGVKVSKIVGLADDIKLNLAAADIRIEAPIPGKPAVGIEVPNKEKTPVSFRELIESDTFQKFPSKIPFAVGKDIGGQVIVADIAKMPHLMVAGSTGSGKSVCINSLIVSILYKARPEDVKLIMVDPKKVEFSVYNGIPHLLIPVVTDPKKAAGALNWAVVEMTNRYQTFAQYNVRNLQGYNEKVVAATGSENGNEEMPKLPQIVIIIDELADLMMVAHGEVEDAIVRLAQLARAAGIHMIIATQRPSADVITGLIKANVPSRIAMKVANGMESRIILDQLGAEKLLGNGDMMFYPTGYQKPVRVQGAFLSDGEIEDIVDFIKNQQGEVQYDQSVEAEITGASSANSTSAGAGEPEVDDYFADAGRFIIGKDKASIGMLQRVYKIGFNRAARIMDQLSDAGVVGPEEGTKPRKVLMSMEEFENYCDEHL